MQITSQKIGANDALNCIQLPAVITTADVKIPAKNVVFAIDVSGSMSYELRLIRQQLKNKIPSLIGPNDTITIIWFSGNNQAGVLQEGVEVKNLVDLQKLNDSIDRFLQPIGLTAFLPPLELTEQVINNLKGNKKAFSFIFLSDGYNNDSAWPKVIAKVTELEPKIGAAAFIEYGYYADSQALSEMAELMGGEKIFSKDFDAYEESFEKIVGRNTSPKRVVDISTIKGVKYGFFFAINEQDQSILTFSSRNEQELLVPQDIKELYFLTRYKYADEASLSLTPKLAAAFLLADRLRYNAVEDFLSHIGDISLLNEFGGAFGKDRLNSLKDRIKRIAFNEEQAYSEGQQEGYKIDPKRFCLIDLIEILQSGENYFLPFNKAFSYNRIGAKTVTKVELTDETKEQLAAAKTLAETQKALASIETAEFVYPENAGSVAVNFEQLVWNSSRANLSVRAQLFGTVKLPTNEFGLTEVPSFIYRNYTIVKDGVLNITHIPVVLDEATHELLLSKGLKLEGNYHNGMQILDISSLPIINRSMTTNVSGKVLAQHEFDLISTQAELKYLKHLKAEFDPKTNDKSAEKYSPEAAAWLKSIGVDDYNGFNPKKETVESEDTYMAPSLVVKIQNTSALPTVKAVLDKSSTIQKAEAGEKIEGKLPKLNLLETLMKSHIETIDNTVPEDDAIATLNAMFKDVDNRRKSLLHEIARIKFGVILSRTWFKEFENMDENTLEGVVLKGIPDKTPLKVKFEFKEETIKL